MTIVEMTKKQVIEALRAEKLTSGAFIRGRGHALGHVTKAKDCAVCAVGAVVRKALAATASERDVEDIIVTRAKLPTLLRKLSDVYEVAVCGDVGGLAFGGHGFTKDKAEAGRAAAIAHVRKHFPARIRIDISNAKPRRGMKIVTP